MPSGSTAHLTLVATRLPPRREEVRGFASRPHERFAFGTQEVLDNPYIDPLGQHLRE